MVTSKKSRRKFSNEFKAKVAIEAIKEQSTLSELSKKFGVHQGVISNWKSEFIASSSLAFGGSKPKEEEISTDELYKRIGQLEIENNFLKKSLIKIGQ